MNLEEMEKRLKVLEDIEEIKKLHIHYVNCLTFAQWDEIVKCFTEDAVLDFFSNRPPVQGREAQIKTFQGMSRVHLGKEGNFVVHPLITVDGDKAKATWLLYMMYAHQQTWQSLFWYQLIYYADYVRQDGKWLISILKVRFRLMPPSAPNLPIAQT